MSLKKAHKNGSKLGSPQKDEQMAFQSCLVPRARPEGSMIKETGCGCLENLLRKFPKSSARERISQQLCEAASPPLEKWEAPQGLESQGAQAESNTIHRSGVFLKNLETHSRFHSL